MLETLKTLCERNGTSGREENIRNYIIGRIQDKCEYQVDPLGNILVFKKGRNRPKNKVMLTAHMDEVGFIITYITDDGYLKFDCVGGIDEKVIVGRNVTVGEKQIPGVIGLKAVHLCDSDEREKAPKVRNLYIDIGADSRQQAEEYVEIGDVAYFMSVFEPIGESKIKAKAIDDRFGCCVMLKMIESYLEYDMHFAFLVQEEVGLRGAGAAAYTIKPDYAVVIEATTAADVANVTGADRVCCQGEGAVVSFMDRSTVYSRELYKKAFQLAAENGIPIQTKTAVAGGNDAGAIHKANAGIKTLTVSLPCRYIHSATSVADTRDMASCYALVKLLSEDFANA